jgi:hypothetical protein
VDKKRLEKMLGMLGSEHAGERASAALLISRMAKAEGATVVQLMEKAFAPPQYAKPATGYGGAFRDWQTTNPNRGRPVRQPVYDDDEFASEIISALRNVRAEHLGSLRKEERTFIATVLTSCGNDASMTEAERISAETIIKKYSKGKS